MSDRIGEELMSALVAEAVHQARDLAQLAGRPGCGRLEATLAAARLRYLALCHRTVADRLMAQALRFENGWADEALAA